MPDGAQPPAGGPPAEFAGDGNAVDSEEGTLATIWIADSDTEIHPVTVRTGITDGVNTVILDGEELLGKKVVVGKQSAAAYKAAQASDQPTNPFMPRPPNRGGNRRGGAGGPPPR